MRKNSIKNTRVNGAVLKELSTIIHSEIKDPRIHPMTSVTAVEVAPDLKTCKAYISVLGEKQAKDSTIRQTAMAEIESMTPRTSQWREGEEIPEKHWMYWLAKKFFFNDFGVYQNLKR